MMETPESELTPAVTEPVKAAPKKRAPRTKTAEFVAKVNGSIEGASGTRYSITRGDVITANANEFDHLFTDGSSRQLKKK